jgi:hypothetical protein
MMPEGLEPKTEDLSSLIRALIRGSGDDRDLRRASRQALAVGASAFAFGLARGRWGGVEIGGVPIDLGAGVLLHLLGLSGVAGSGSDDLHNLAEGALATYFATWGASLGKRMRNGEQILPGSGAQRGAAPGKAANGTPPASDVQLMELIRSAISS